MDKERSLDEIKNTCDMACKILKRTNDGDDLTPSHLSLTENAVNGNLTPKGIDAFQELYRQVTEDGYTKPFLHEIEHITNDNEGYVYYKGINVEHYDLDYVYSADAKKNLTELKSRCEYLESKGIEVTGGNVIWKWDDYVQDYGKEKMKQLDKLLPDEYTAIQYAHVSLYNSAREFDYYTFNIPKNLDEIKAHEIPQSMIGRYFDNEFDIKVTQYRLGRGEPMQPDVIKNIEEADRLLNSCHEYFKTLPLFSQKSVTEYKTDFAEGYDSIKKLDGLLQNTDGANMGKSFEYSRINLYAGYHFQGAFFTCGKPDLKQLSNRPEVIDAACLCDEKHKFSMNVDTFTYGKGEKLDISKLPDTEAIESHLCTCHDYMEKHNNIQLTDMEVYDAKDLQGGMNQSNNGPTMKM